MHSRPTISMQRISHQNTAENTKKRMWTHTQRKLWKNTQKSAQKSTQSRSKKDM